ncbi:deoxyribose-phosphate aldolase [Polaribacter undariae]|uniref:Deoxyribose-phosphate aldolase n=2 Tax=Polaribacter sejongensis TaxID=985043 RepID=A0AAJ1QUP1_9FLAO|nr:deoxyribose-phosphate aldolase [Polaribacter undariae]MDN3618415.1 deoxyribose-phosphate aldolase [Polaribacter undariae]UWD30601.1 deoxyribose-phosphate aldolase [Polaribacter undariae]
MKISQYLDATYLKTASQANLTEEENKQNVIDLIQEAILYDYKLIMIRAKYIPLAKEMLQEANKSILIGTVIGFHEGTYTTQEKLEEAQEAINLGADELDFVVNYEAFKRGELQLVTNEITKGIALALDNNKVIKWIIEVAALTNKEIIVISRLIKNIVFTDFGEENAENVFVKSSTGFFKTENNLPNGATLETMKLIAENAKPLKIKAAGGVRDYETALKMVALGVDRIGTSSSKEIVNKEQNSNSGY